MKPGAVRVGPQSCLCVGLGELLVEVAEAELSASRFCPRRQLTDAFPGVPADAWIERLENHHERGALLSEELVRRELDVGLFERLNDDDHNFNIDASAEDCWYLCFRILPGRLQDELNVVRDEGDEVGVVVFEQPLEVIGSRVDTASCDQALEEGKRVVVLTGSVIAVVGAKPNDIVFPVPPGDSAVVVLMPEPTQRLEARFCAYDLAAVWFGRTIFDKCAKNRLICDVHELCIRREPEILSQTPTGDAESTTVLKGRSVEKVHMTWNRNAHAPILGGGPESLG